MNYLKKNHLSLLIILYLVVITFVGGSVNLGARDTTNITNPWNFEDPVSFEETVAITGAVSLASTVTITDGTITIANVVQEYTGITSLSQSTNTPCVLLSPLAATSTLESAHFEITVATTAPELEIEMFRTAHETYATSGGSQIGTKFVWLNTSTGIDDVFPSIRASTTPTGSAIIFPPGTTFVVAVSSAEMDDGDFDLTGTCSALFREF